MQNATRKRARAREARLRSDGCSLWNQSFSRMVGRTGASTAGSTGSKPAYNSDCTGLGVALIGTPPHVLSGQALAPFSSEAPPGRAFHRNSWPPQRALSVGSPTLGPKDADGVSAVQHCLGCHRPGLWSGREAIEVVQIRITEAGRSRSRNEDNPHERNTDVPRTDLLQRDRRSSHDRPVGLQAAIDFRGRSAGVTQARESSARREAFLERG